MDLRICTHETGAFFGFYTEGHVDREEMAAAVKERIGASDEVREVAPGLRPQKTVYVPESTITHEYTCAECGMLGVDPAKAGHGPEETRDEDFTDCKVEPITVWDPSKE